MLDPSKAWRLSAKETFPHLIISLPLIQDIFSCLLLHQIGSHISPCPSPREMMWLLSAQVSHTSPWKGCAGGVSWNPLWGCICITSLGWRLPEVTNLLPLTRINDFLPNCDHPMSNPPGMSVSGSLIFALPHRREEFAGTAWKLSMSPSPSQSVTDKKSNIVKHKLVQIIIKRKGCIGKNAALMWFKPINVSECLHFGLCLFLWPVGVGIPEKGSWFHVDAPAQSQPGFTWQALDWVVVRHHICSKGEFVWKTIFGNQGLRWKMKSYSYQWPLIAESWCGALWNRKNIFCLRKHAH